MTAYSVSLESECGRWLKKGRSDFGPGLWSRRSRSGSGWGRRCSLTSWNRCLRRGDTRSRSCAFRRRSRRRTPRTTWFTPSISPPWAGPKRPGVIVLHILGADFPLSRYMAARLADRGVAALFVKLPYYGERRPAGPRGGVPSDFCPADIERSVTRCARPFVTCGGLPAGWRLVRISTPSGSGSLESAWEASSPSLVAAVDPGDPRRGLPAGRRRPVVDPLGDARGGARIASNGSNPAARDRPEGLTDPFDPLTYADGLVGKRLLMIAGKVDEVVPPSSTLLLWEAAGRPTIHWCDCGHYSAVGYLLPGIRQTVDFFAPSARSRGRNPKKR